MNLFIGVGKISNTYENGRVLKFTLSVQQERPCSVPCLIFDPDEHTKRVIEDLRVKGQTVWLQGRIASSEYENNGKSVSRFAVITYPKSVKTI